MRKTILIMLLSLLYSINFVQAGFSLKNSQKELPIKKLSLFTGNYQLLYFNVKVSLNKNNKLILTVPIVSKSAEKYTERTIKIFPLLKGKQFVGIFPYHGDYELLPVSNSVFRIQNSGGLSIEFIKKENDFDKKLVLHDINFNILDKQNFGKIISIHKTTITEVVKVQPQTIISSVKNNMHSLQIILEAYAIDRNFTYPNNLVLLIKEAKKNNLWKEFYNPISKKSGLGKEGSLLDFNDYKNLPMSSQRNGMVIYESLNCKNDNKIKKIICKSYKIYGADEKGKFIKDKDSNYYLHNY